jgi:hypothetical protein
VPPWSRFAYTYVTDRVKRKKNGTAWCPHGHVLRTRISLTRAVLELRILTPQHLSPSFLRRLLRYANASLSLPPSLSVPPSLFFCRGSGDSYRSRGTQRKKHFLHVLSPHLLGLKPSWASDSGEIDRVIKSVFGRGTERLPSGYRELRLRRPSVCCAAAASRISRMRRRIHVT